MATPVPTPMHRPIKTVATASKLAICVINMPYFVVFLEFCPSNSQRKYRDRMPTWHLTVGNGHHAEI